MTEREALKLALDKKAENARELGLDYEPENTLHWHALNYRTAPTQNAQKMFDALEKFVETAIKKALAQPEPPPECKTEAEKTAFAFGWWKALEAQRTWVGLTWEDANEIAIAHDVRPSTVKAIEAKLKEKNT